MRESRKAVQVCQEIRDFSTLPQWFMFFVQASFVCNPNNENDLSIETPSYTDFCHPLIDHQIFIVSWENSCIIKSENVNSISVFGASSRNKQCGDVRWNEHWNRFCGIIKLLSASSTMLTAFLFSGGRWNWICVGSGERASKRKTLYSAGIYNGNDIWLGFQWHWIWMIQLVRAMNNKKKNK